MSKIVKASNLNLKGVANINIENKFSDNPLLFGAEKIDLTEQSDKEQQEQNNDFYIKNEQQIANEQLDQKYNEIVQKANEEAEQIAQDIIQKANEEAEQIKEQVKAEAFESGKSEGFDTGYKEGEQKAISENRQKKVEAENLLKEAEAEKEKVISEMESEIVDVIQSIVSDVLDTAFSVSDEAIIMAVKMGLKKAMILEKVVVKVSENDYLDVIENIEQLKKIIDSSKEIEVIKDFNLVQGDCVLETEYGYIDCSLHQMKNSLKNNLALIMKMEAGEEKI